MVVDHGPRPLKHERSESLESRRNRLFPELIRRRSRNVERLIQIEEMLVVELDIEEQFPEKEFEEVTADMPTPQQKMVGDILEQYRLEQRESKRIFTDLEILFKKIRWGRDSKAPKREPTIWEMGEFIFRAETGKRPKGRIVFETDGPNIVMACLDEADYETFCYPEKKQNSKTGGRYFPEGHPLVVEHSRLPKISHVKTIHIPNLIVINGYDNYHDTLRHEKQHYIHHNLLQVFQAIEPFKPRQEATLQHSLEFEGSLRRVKDECIAMIGDTTSGEAMESHLASETYTHLTRALDERHKEQKETIHTLIRSVCRAISDAKDLLQDPQMAKRFVYHLLDVPFTDFPVWIPAVASFYRERIARQRQANTA